MEIPDSIECIHAFILSQYSNLRERLILPLSSALYAEAEFSCGSHEEIIFAMARREFSSRGWSLQVRRIAPRRFVLSLRPSAETVREFKRGFYRIFNEAGGSKARNPLNVHTEHTPNRIEPSRLLTRRRNRTL